MKLNDNIETTFVSDCDPGDENDMRAPEEPAAPSFSEPAGPSFSELTRSAGEERVGLKPPFPAGF